jgi:hypothetical protein
MTTKAEMRQKVAENLALVPVGQAVQSQDQARIDAVYSEIYQRIKEENLAVWASTAEVPDKVSHFYALMMEQRLAISYGISDARYQRILGESGPEGDEALKKIARLLTPAYESTVENQDY